MQEEQYTQYVWHPFTQMKTADAPLFIESGKGALLFGKNGERYIDAISSWWVNIHGHANEHIAARIAEQAKKLEQVIFAGFTHAPAMQLAESLIHCLPPHFAKVFYSDNGSTSVEVAIKMALQYWHNKGQNQKTQIIAFENAYHGDTFGAMSVGARSKFNQAFQKHLFEVIHLPLPNKDNISALKQHLQTLSQQKTIAAFIFEPLLQGAGGMLNYAAEHLDELILIAQQNEIICIADEVMTGFGRTGKRFAINYLKQVPEIICLSKGITGGFMPLGVTVCSQKIYDAFYADEREKTFFHGHSYTANPLACAAANASLELLLDPKCEEQIHCIVAKHTAFANELKAFNTIENIRQQGTILAFDIKSDSATSYFNTLGKDAYKFFIQHGVLLRPLGNTIYIMPPYCISNSELNQVYETIKMYLNHQLALDKQ